MNAETTILGGDGVFKGVPLPKYKCHKEVHALKIKSVRELVNNEVQLQFEGPHLPRMMSMDWKVRHKPKAGGYWVQYKDGYESYSPPEAFEEGYAPAKEYEYAEMSKDGLVAMYVLDEEGEAQLKNWFTYHPPGPGEWEKYQDIREAAKHFARVVILMTPSSADQSAALRKIREAVMTANAAIACKGK